MIKILLIHKHIFEKIILRRNLKRAAYLDFDILQVEQFSDAVTPLLKNHFDIVLLEDTIDETMTLEFSVPFIRAYLPDSPIVMISDISDSPYLHTHEEMGVDYVVNKTDLSTFMMKLLPIFETQASI